VCANEQAAERAARARACVSTGIGKNAARCVIKRFVAIQVKCRMNAIVISPFAHGVHMPQRCQREGGPGLRERRAFAAGEAAASAGTPPAGRGACGGQRRCQSVCRVREP
jgi:hypothetical protein